jgi:6-pyruvoyl-tetrahydropterin synthase
MMPVFLKSCCTIRNERPESTKPTYRAVNRHGHNCVTFIYLDINLATSVLTVIDLRLVVALFSSLLKSLEQQVQNGSSS